MSRQVARGSLCCMWIFAFLPALNELHLPYHSHSLVHIFYSPMGLVKLQHVFHAAFYLPCIWFLNESSYCLLPIRDDTRVVDIQQGKC
jgi:hypothetical protein